MGPSAPVVKPEDDEEEMWGALPLLPLGGSSSYSSSPEFVTKRASKVLPQPRGRPVTGVEITHWLLLTPCVIFKLLIHRGAQGSPFPLLLLLPQSPCTETKPKREEFLFLTMNKEERA